MENKQLLDISWSTILKIGIGFFGFYILYLIRDILSWVIFALIISVLFSPAIDFLQRRRIPRGAAIILIYTGIFGILGLLIYYIFPPVISETQQFLQLFPQYFEKMSPPLRELGIEAFESFEVFTQTLHNWLIQASSSIFSAIASIFGGIFAALTIFIIAIFLSFEEKGVEKAINLISPQKYENGILELWKKSQNKISGWFGARILSSLFVGLITLIACKILAIRYLFSFAILAAVTNIIPVVGPLMAGIIIFILTVLTSWWKAVFILIVFILIQQIEGSILTPILTKKFIGLSPVLVLIFLMIGAKLWGILGAILAIPIGGIIFEFSRDFLKKRKEEVSSGITPKKTIIW